MKQSAIVFSPHMDDETLGCGGTIIKKIRAGADLRVVFMTDGSRSHEHLISREELKAIRAAEALVVTEKLGVDQKGVIFLEFEDGKLAESRDTATKKVSEILKCYRPREIFIPHYGEEPRDHFVTNKIVLSALRVCRQQVTIYEYPVWLWCEWPWVSEPARKGRGPLRIFKRMLFANLTILRDFRCSVDISNVLDSKFEALNHYKSQMSQLIPDSRWPTLNDVSNGEFLNRFVQEYEVFHLYSFPGK